jgi:hypothetical protein
MQTVHDETSSPNGTAMRPSPEGLMLVLCVILIMLLNRLRHNLRRPVPVFRPEDDQSSGVLHMLFSAFFLQQKIPRNHADTPRGSWHLIWRRKRRCGLVAGWLAGRQLNGSQPLGCH